MPRASIIRADQLSYVKDWRLEESVSRIKQQNFLFEVTDSAHVSIECEAVIC